VSGTPTNCAAATDTDIEMQPVLDRLTLRYHLEPDPRPPPVRIHDAVRAKAQLIPGHPDIPPVGIPALEPSCRLLPRSPSWQDGRTERVGPQIAPA
jgi:hypothetical protein